MFANSSAVSTLARSTARALLLLVSLLAAPFMAIAQPTPDAAASLVPPAILNAKTVFLANGGADAGLFPEPFSGDPNRGYFGLYSQIKTAGKYQLVPGPSQADLVFELHLAAPLGPRDAGKQYGAADPLPFFELRIYDTNSHFLLWTITEPIYMAVLQKTHDRNFDEALSNLAADIAALSQPSAESLYPHPAVRLDRWRR